MRHGSLFSGIGGFDLAAQWMGWENVFQVEIGPFCQAVLKKHFPNTARYGDIKEFDGTRYRGAIDILSGGFPCQPFSKAGKRKGKDDDRYLWPEMLRIIGEIRPSYVVGENVGGSWQLVDEICTALEAQGFTTEPINIEAACVGADHLRERYWFMAYSKRIVGARVVVHRNGDKETRRDQGTEIRREDRNGYKMGPAPDTGVRVWGEQFSGPKLVRISDGLSPELDRIRGLGNAIVPQVAYEIFKAIEATMKTEG